MLYKSHDSIWLASNADNRDGLILMSGQFIVVLNLLSTSKRVDCWRKIISKEEMKLGTYTLNLSQIIRVQVLKKSD